MSLDPDTYAEKAEDFLSALSREYYLHFAGHKESFEIEQIYEQHRGLFGPEVVDELRARLDAGEEDEQRRSRYLLQLAVEGVIGNETREQAAALAEREAALEIEFDGTRESYRAATITQANEPDASRRAAIEDARLSALERELNPLHEQVMARSHELAAELGWPSYREMFADLKGVDLAALERQTRAFIDVTARPYRELVGSQLEAQIGIGLDRLRRSDLPYFFRGPRHDSLFPAEDLLDSLEQTLRGIGVELRDQANVKLDVEGRPRKSPRAFCAPVRVPDEVYLVLAPHGGHDDYATLFHEAGHTEHYAAVDRRLPFEYRYLGDNSVTEGFAFLFQHLTEDRNWLRSVLGIEDSDGFLEYARASELVYLRRYAAKLTYELELHSGGRPLSEMPPLYSRLLGDALEIEWPQVSYLADVDEGYYAANYLRAWAFEAQLRRFLEDRFGPEWFRSPEVGALLREIWREGQRLDAEELLRSVTGEDLDFGVMAAAFEDPPSAG